MCLPTGKTEPLDLHHISSCQEAVNITKKNKIERESLILEMFCKEEFTDIYYPEHQSLPSGLISGNDSKGVACMRVGDKAGELE